MKIKKFFYILSAGFLGFLLHIIFHIVAEVLYIKYLASQGRFPEWNNLFGGLEALPIWSVIVMAVAGVILGIYLGFIWWRIVYIEKRHWRFKERK